MGIFNTYEQIKSGKQRISENFLKEMGFEKSKQWGAPWKWDTDTEFWEKIIHVDDCYTDASIYYFPDTFDGYVTPFSMRGVKPKNHFLGWVNSDSSNKEWTGNANNKMDIMVVIDEIKQYIEKYFKIY